VPNASSQLSLDPTTECKWQHCWEGGRLAHRPTPPSPTTSNGALEGWEAGTQFGGREVSSITESMARRSASARPSDLSFASAPIAVVMSFTVAALSTYQCDTSSARAPA